MGKIITFGEVIMRLSPVGNKKIQQTEHLDYFFGGTELNVAASLANLGIEVKLISNLSNDIIGEVALIKIKNYGIETSHINFVDHPLGLYFLEVGASMRPSKIAYNRLNGAFSKMEPEMVDWNDCLNDVDLFHWTGISPGISNGAYLTLKEGLVLAKERGVSITTDPTYRKNLWNYGIEGATILRELVSYSTIFIGGVNEINELLGSSYDTGKEGFVKASKALKSAYPAIIKIFDKVRLQGNSSWQQIFGRAWIDGQYVETQKIDISHVVDRIGAGDAFAAGLIYGLQHFDDARALSFGNAACALKHTIVGDVNLVSLDEIVEVEKGDLTGRIKR